MSSLDAALRNDRLGRWLSHAISASLLVATVAAVVMIERSQSIAPEATAAEPSPSAMF